MDIQHTLRLQLQDQNGGEALGDTCDPKQRVGADGFPILQRSAAPGDIERGPSGRETHMQADSREAFRLVKSGEDSVTDELNPRRFALRIGWNLRGRNSSCGLRLAAL